MSQEEEEEEEETQHTFIRSDYQECPSAWQTAQLIKLTMCVGVPQSLCWSKFTSVVPVSKWSERWREGGNEGKKNTEEKEADGKQPRLCPKSSSVSLQQQNPGLR